MAEDTNNINSALNNATVGLNQDQTLNQIKSGTLTYALNAVVENFDANSVNYQNEPKNEFCVAFPSGYSLVGTHFINEQNKHIFFLANPTTGNSQIGYMINNDCQYRLYVESPCLGFNINSPIHKIVHRITNCSTELFWPDNVARRHLDLENIPYKLQSGSTLCDPKYSNELDCNQLNVQPNFTIPEIEVVDVITGGTNKAGTYQFAAQYSDANGNPYTSYYSITNPIPLEDKAVTSVNFDYAVGKSIVVNISNLETSGEFSYFNLAVIRTVNAISSVELIGTFFITESTKQIIYSGQNATNIRLSMNDIFEKYPFYEMAEDITAVQDVLVWKGLTSVERINYQSIASKITLQWETYKIPATEDYSVEVNAANLRGFLRDEIYPFEVVFLLDNGKETDGFHIPGKVKGAVENTNADIPDTHPDFIGEPELGMNTSPYWKIYNTASVIGNSSGPPIGNATPHQYGEFAYWESTEEYPCNVDVWGELAGQKIRHHKFPDVNISPIFESKIFSSATSLEMGNASVYPIGVRINPQQVRILIDSSDLTAEQKASIIGFKIIRGNRGTNKSIIAKGMLRNINKYKRDEDTYYYPNYPYNDLRSDPFLTITNNAYTQLCKSYNINIGRIGFDSDNNVIPVQVKYYNCNTNKEGIETFETLGTHQLCSTAKPRFSIDGDADEVRFEGSGSNTIELGTYDRWEVYTCLTCRGWRVAWDDAILGPTSTWVPGNSTGTTILHVVPGSGEPRKIDGKGKERKRFLGTVTGGGCDASIPLPGTMSDPSLGYRQIFNSPETSFAQPFLGDVLKLESVMFGAGKAHFVEVKNNAKYKLLSKEAQLDAIESSRQIGALTHDTFNATAMFSAYQSYLTIYTNGITRKNYAKSFNSRANYDYSVGVPDNEGIKQRQLDIKRYLIPNVLNIGDDHNINNYQRETSVYLKTKDKALNNVVTIDPLPFPSDSTNMLSAGDPIVEDRSRFTLSEKTLCGTPTAEQDISVVSYYASLKNSFPNQWGQIYSYETVDTGYQFLFNHSTKSVIFGGDTFIGRHAYKTKLPFFIDNRVGAPDDSDIFYDEIGNIAYPKYWHSARSILSNYTINEATLTNFISYKAHEFDCPNSQELPKESEGRTYYDGSFYLFAYGIPNFYCESSYNLDLRAAFNTREGDFWPHVSSGIPDDWVQESFVSIANDNTYHYNVTYSKQNRENTFTHLPPDWEKDFCNTYYPFRAIYSEPQNTDSDNKVNNWLIYKALSYFDFPQNYGLLTSIDGIQNRAILARFENKSLLYNNLLTIDTSNPQAAYVGNPSLFKGAPPIDFAETDLGYVGSQHKLLLKIPQGQITIDAKRGQVFLIQGTQAQDISAYGSGMNRFFTDHLAFEILKYFPDRKELINGEQVTIKGINIDNHYNGIGLHAVYDSKFERVIITKLDYVPLDPNISYDPTTNEFYHTTTIEIPESFTLTNVKYGALYNWFVFNPGKTLAPEGWRLPSAEDYNILGATLSSGSDGYFPEAGGKLKEDNNLYWTTPNVGADNSSGFYGRGSGFRNPFSGNFEFIKEFIGLWTSTIESSQSKYAVIEAGGATLFVNSLTPLNQGLSIRFIKEDSNDSGIMVGNDGKVYPTVKIGDQVWMAANLAETKYTDGSIIPEVTDGPTWVGLTTGAICYYNNDSTNSYSGSGKAIYAQTIIKKTKVDLKDKDYFCNKSWTISYNLNTQSWISFHSYIPNWYIAENNFFYSGLNSCCDDFDFVAGEIVPTPSTTTTTTSSTSSTTTTTTTQVPFDCTLGGNILVTNCEIEGTGVVTVEPTPPPCQRPTGMEMFSLITGYTIIIGPTPVVSTGSQTDACDAIDYINSLDEETLTVTIETIGGFAFELIVGNTVYDNNSLTGCEVVPDGWYYTDETAASGVTFHIVNGVIVEMVNCNPAPPTTTTSTSSTTTLPPCLTYQASTLAGPFVVTWINCDGIEETQGVGGVSGFDMFTFCATTVINGGGADITFIGVC